MSLYLEQVRITNFRTFGAFTLEIPSVPGALIVTGPNGLGKSSFFDAIEWALTSDVKRLSPHAGREETEADYLTRDGAEPYSHAVQLGFTGGHVDRRGHAAGTRGTAIEEVKTLLVSESWPEQVKDLATYLALTHFLGQGADQRFMSRDSREQWRTLRAPSGVERLETIRRRLRGRSATIAMNRRGEAAAAELRVQEDRLAQWDSRLQRLRLLEGIAAAAGAPSREEIERSATRLRDRAAIFAGELIVPGPADLSENLVQLAEWLADVGRDAEQREMRLMGLERVSEQYAELQGRIAAEAAQLEDLRAQKRSNDEALRARASSADQLDRERRQRRERVQRLRERLSLLLAAEADLRDATAAETDARAVRQAIGETNEALAQHRAAASDTDRELDAWQAARDAVALAGERHTVAQAIAQQADGLVELERRMADAQSAQTAAAEVASAVDEAALAAAASRAAELVEIRKIWLEERRQRADVLSAALVSLAANLTDHDTNCPVCRTGFPAGELKRLADLSARETDESLPAAQEQLDEAFRAHQAAEAAVVAARRSREALAAAEAALGKARRDLEATRAAVAARLQSEVVSNLVGAARSRLVHEAEALDGARRALTLLEARAPELQRRRTQTRNHLERLEAQLRGQRAQLTRAEADRTAADSRFQVRLGGEGVERGTLPILAAHTEADLTEAEGAHASAEEAYHLEASALGGLRAEAAQLTARIGERDRLRAEYQQQAEGLLEHWRTHGLAGAPAHIAFEAALGGVREVRAGLQALEAARRRLAEALEATAGREELEGLRRALESEAGGSGFDEHRAKLESDVTASRRRSARIGEAQAAINLLAARLQDEADIYSSDVLRPLNNLIGAFNDALLTNPGTSVAFNTEYFADRTDFAAQLQLRVSEGADPVRRQINPRLVLSEGQLAANGFSILCSASISYPWSTWRALVLDDPLQHNDVIHAAAFTDLMRNLVELRGYQVLMSSHDRAETEFIERKFSAAALPCTVVQLIADSPRGVTFEVRNNGPARDALRARELRVG